MNFTTFDKAIVAGLPLGLQILQLLGATPAAGPVAGYANLALAILTPVLVYLKGNAQPAAK